MSEISEAAKLKACELLNAHQESEQWDIDDVEHVPAAVVLTEVLQAVSNAAKTLSDTYGSGHWIGLQVAPFILPDPADPLVDVLNHAMTSTGVVLRIDRANGELPAAKLLDGIREGLAARGLKIVEAQS